MRNAPIILVPGFWLGGWAWDEVAGLLRDDGFDVTALTLPGMESKDADRSKVGFADHVDAIVKAIEASRRRSCSPSTARPGSRATRRATASPSGSPPWSTSTARRALRRRTRTSRTPRSRSSGRSSRPRRTSTACPTSSRRRSVSAACRSLAASCATRSPLTNDARNDIPSTLICTAYTAEDYQKYAADEPAMSWLAGVRRAAQRDLDRHADEPLADVLEAARARRPHRGGRAHRLEPGHRLTCARRRTGTHKEPLVCTPAHA